MGRALTPFVSGRTFLLLMAGATIGPLILAVLYQHADGLAQSCPGTAIQILTLVAAPHVLTRLYLVVDRRGLAGVRRPARTIYAIAAAMIVMHYALLRAAPPAAMRGYVLIFLDVVT